jgi:hypothetical protein
MVQNCRFWPLIRALKPEASFRDTVVIKPSKAEETLAKRAHMVIKPSKVEETLAKQAHTRGLYQSKNEFGRQTSRAFQLLDHPRRDPRS